MIALNELRVGSWVEHNANWCYRSPSEIKPFVFQWEDRDYYALSESTLSLEDCLPIQITPEILDNCLFELEHKSEWTIKYSLIKDGRFGFDWNKNFGWRARFFAEHFNHIQHLHKLQNLYYALTGEELIYKP